VVVLEVLLLPVVVMVVLVVFPVTVVLGAALVLLVRVDWV